jgi:hypothetical protein
LIYDPAKSSEKELTFSQFNIMNCSTPTFPIFYLPNAIKALKFDQVFYDPIMPNLLCNDMTFVSVMHENSLRQLRDRTFLLSECYLIVDDGIYSFSKSVQLSFPLIIEKKSNNFSNSLQISSSNQFSSTIKFSSSFTLKSTFSFWLSSWFSLISQLSSSKQFSVTLNFFESNLFNFSHHFSKTPSYLMTSNFSKTSPVAESSNFLFSQIISKSFPFSITDLFSSSKFYSDSKLFIESIEFSFSLQLSNSKHFSVTFAFLNQISSIFLIHFQIHRTI